VEIENIDDGASFVGAEVGFYELPKRCLLRCPGLFVSDGAILKGCNDASKLLRLPAVLQSSLSKISSFGIHKRNLLEARVIIATYNNHRRLLSTRAFWLVGTTKVYSGIRSR
jgi:hypothetical protein